MIYRQYSCRQWLSASLIVVWSFTASGTVAGHELVKHVIDADHKERIATLFNHSSYLYGKGIRIMVYEGQATLSGKLHSGVVRDLAKQVALGVEGITSVDNRLVVESDYLPELTRSGRSYPQMVARAEARAMNRARGKVAAVTSSGERSGWGGGDLWINAKVRFAFMFSRSIDSGNITVSTRNGIVSIRGHIADGAGYALVVARAGNIQGVKGIDASGFSHTPAAKDKSEGGSTDVAVN